MMRSCLLGLLGDALHRPKQLLDRFFVRVHAILLWSQDAERRQTEFPTFFLLLSVC
jgi:hypothetical protein